MRGAWKIVEGVDEVWLATTSPTWTPPTGAHSLAGDVAAAQLGAWASRSDRPEWVAEICRQLDGPTSWSPAAGRSAQIRRLRAALETRRLHAYRVPIAREGGVVEVVKEAIPIAGGFIEATDWIEIVLIDEDDQPVPNVAYEITLPDGTVDPGRTDQGGVARYPRIEPGDKCSFSFTGLDEEAWGPA